MQNFYAINSIFIFNLLVDINFPRYNESFLKIYNINLYNTYIVKFNIMILHCHYVYSYVTFIRNINENITVEKISKLLIHKIKDDPIDMLY